MGRKSSQKKKSETSVQDTPESAESAALTKRRRALILPVCLLLLVAIGSGIYLTYLYVEVRAAPQGVSVQSFCNVSETVNCVKVAESPWATFIGVPTSVLAFEFYALALLMVILSAGGRIKIVAWDSLLFMMMLVGLPVSAYLAYVSIVLLKSLCLLCTVIYGVNLLLVLLLAIGSKSSLGALLRDGLGELGQRARTSNKMQAALVALIAVGASQFIWLPPMIPQRPPALGHDAAANDPWGNLPRQGMTIGNPRAKVTIEEFSDFQCPHCRDMHEVMIKVMKAVGGKAKLVHHDYPLDHHCNRLITRLFHPFACEAAFFARCAAKQGKFWRYASILFSRQDSLTRSYLESYARSLKLDEKKLKACVDGSDAKNEVLRDIEEGIRRDIKGTPTFFINGKQITKGKIGEVSFWTRKVEEALKR
ncbi:MAG: thioredoxin domain-containing protein [Myxococcales bacterium]|nr:thioredoxin domain-containing protein [Myxococcales bacterium]